MHLPSDHRSALLAFAAAAYEVRPLPTISGWAALLGAAQRHGLVPLANRSLQESAAPENVKRVFRGHALVEAAHSARLERELAKVLTALGEAGVPSIVLKGPALARSIYPSPWLRPYRDLDLLCREEDWEKTQRVLLGLGFRCLQPHAAPPPKVWDRKAYYHSQFQDEEGSVRVEVHYDLWWYGLRPRLGERFWQRAVSLDVAGVPTQMVSPEDQLLQLGLHLHHHGFSRLIWFADLALLLRQAERFDWHYVVWAARREGVGLFLYYSLAYVERLLGVAAPGWVLDALRPAPFQAWLHDRLWSPEGIMSVAVEDRTLSDFHEVPEALELLINLLLTGRRWEKLIYLSRLLAPSSAWLAYYYGTTDPETLRSRRLVHAPKLLLKALGELGSAARDGVARRPL